MHARLVLGLGFGDEGKGTIVDWLARRCASPPLIVRWNGGPQAAHHVVTAAGRVHCFAQLGSGSFVDGARTHLGHDMAIDPYALQAEAAVFGGDVLRRLTIDPRAPVVTPWHAIAGEIRELARGDGRHGSTGRGIFDAKLGPVRLTAGALVGRGAADAIGTLRDEILARIPGDAGDAARELVARGRERDLFDAFHDAASRLDPAALTATPPLADDVILESAQGALLDRELGFFPYVTPSWVTRRAATIAARDLGIDAFETWGVLRAFHTRHGAGPFPTEDPALAAALPEPHNPPGVAGRFRVGYFDAVLARYALAVAGPIDRLAVTCLDRTAALDAIAVGWDNLGELAAVPVAERTHAALSAKPVLRAVVGDYGHVIERCLGRRIDVGSWGMTAADKVS
jgi:adenylosuccinate synthase